MIEIEADLKPLLANLFRLDFVDYLQTNNFYHVCLEYQMDEYWNDYLMRNRSEYSTNYRAFEISFKEFSSEFYRKDSELFFAVLGGFILDFIKWKKEEIDLESVFYELQNLKIPDKYFKAIKGKSKIEADKKSINNKSSIQNLSITKEGIFIPGQSFDALKHIDKLLLSARKSIIIIDGYINEDILNLLTKKEKKVEVQILTKEVSPSFLTYSKSFNKDYGNLRVRTSLAFHDRFVIIDETEFYHFGHSLKDAGKKVFMFSKIEETFVTKTLFDYFKIEWDKSIVII